ncbi:MAG: recombinase family protein [Spirochaetia bacterium]|jgi:site-specific DNA recombinase
MPKFYAYARVSTKDQDKRYSIETQFEFLSNVFESIPFSESYEKIEVREAQSGKSLEGRAKLQSVLEILAKDDILAIYDISRLGRNNLDNQKILDEITQRGAYLYKGFNRYDPSNPSDEFMFTVESGAATKQRKEQNIKSKSAIRVKIREGEWVFRGDMFGYEVVKEEVKVVEDEAKIILHIYESYASGKSIRQITNELNNSGMTNRSGQVWYRSTVRRYILKPIYMGFYKLEGAGRGRGQEEALLNKDGLVKSKKYPPIVPEDLWWTCNNSYRTVARTHSRQFQYRWSAYELTSIISCGYCKDLGKRISYVHTHVKGRSTSSAWEAYVCRAHKKGCKQSIFTLRADIFEKIFRWAYFIFLSYYQEVEDYFRSQKEDLIELTEVIDHQISTSQLILQEKQRQIGEIVKKVMETESLSIRKGLDSRAKEIEEEIQSVEAKIHKLEDQKQEIVSVDNLDYERWIEDTWENRLAQFILGDPISRRKVHQEVISSATIKSKTLIIDFVNSKRVQMPLIPTKGSRRQRVFDFQVTYKDEDQYKVTFDTTDDSYTYHNLIEDEDNFKVIAGEIYYPFLKKTISKSIEIQKSAAKSARLKAIDSSAKQKG